MNGRSPPKVQMTTSKLEVNVVTIRYLTWHRIYPAHENLYWYQKASTEPFVRAFFDIEGMGMIYVFYDLGWSY